MKVSDVMTRRVEWTHPEATIHEAAEKMKSLDVGSLPVCEHDQVIGMITDRDITVRATADGEEPRRLRVRDVMTTDVTTCREDEEATVAAGLMETKQVRRLVVLNNEGQLVGIVSLGDLAVELGDPEMVGSVLEGVSEPNRPRR